MVIYRGKRVTMATFSVLFVALFTFSTSEGPSPSESSNGTTMPPMDRQQSNDQTKGHSTQPPLEGHANLESDLMPMKTKLQSSTPQGIHGGRPGAPLSSKPVVYDEDKNVDAHSLTGMWMLPYLNPFRTEEFEINYATWKEKVMLMQAMKPPEMEYKNQFVPGVGNLRPFVRMDRPITPEKLMKPLAAGMHGWFGFAGFVYDVVNCAYMGNCEYDE